jgi:DNA-damage-inducible protein J
MAENVLVRARIDERTKQGSRRCAEENRAYRVRRLSLMPFRVAAEKALPFEPLNPNAETVAAMKAGRRCKCGLAQAISGETGGLKMTVTNLFDLYFHHFHRLTKNHNFLLQSPMPLSSQVGNIRSRINTPNASCWPASDCGPEANPLRLMKDRQTGLMKNSPEQSGKIIRERA